MPASGDIGSHRTGCKRIGTPASLCLAIALQGATIACSEPATPEPVTRTAAVTAAGQATPPASKPIAIEPLRRAGVDIWDGLLRRFATARGFRYAALEADAKARAELSSYLDEIAALPESADLARWLNAYNATVVAAVLERYPLQSVMKVEGFFKSIKHRVAGKDRTLDELEHEVIRKRFKDARIPCRAELCRALLPGPVHEGFPRRIARCHTRPVGAAHGRRRAARTDQRRQGSCLGAVFVVS